MPPLAGDARWCVAIMFSAAASSLSTLLASQMQFGPSGFGLAGRAVKLYSLSGLARLLDPTPSDWTLLLGYSLLAVSGGYSG